MKVDVIGALKVAVSILKTVAMWTETKVDDKVVQLLELILSHQVLIDFLEDLINDPAVVETKDDVRNANIAVKAGSAKPEVMQLVQSSGIGWGVLITYLPTIVRLVLSLLGKRG